MPEWRDDNLNTRPVNNGRTLESIATNCLGEIQVVSSSDLLFSLPTTLQPNNHQPEKFHIVLHLRHSQHPQLKQRPVPNGDILIHAGDLTVSGTKQELDDVLSCLQSQPHPL